MEQISRDIINKAITVLLDALPEGSTVILYGSQAKGTSHAESDIDFLVIEPHLSQRRHEMVRLREILRPLRIPVDICVMSRQVFDEWKNSPNTLVHRAHSEGKVYARAA